MKLKKKIIVSFLTLVLTIGMIFGTSSIVMASQHVDGATPVDTITTARIDLQKTLTTDLRGVFPLLNSYSWSIKAVSFQESSVTSSGPVTIPNVNVTKTTTTTETGGVSVTNGASSDTQIVTITDTTTPASSARSKVFNGQFYIDFDDNAPIGVYTYEIMEVADANHPEISYDTTQYYLNIYVVNQIRANQQITGNSTIGSMTIWKNNNTDAANDGNEADNPNDSTDKQEYTTNVVTDTKGEGGSVITTKEGDPLTFTNEYLTESLGVVKYAIGNYASLNHTFTYDVTITDPCAAADTSLLVTYHEYTRDDQIEYIDPQPTPRTIKIGEKTEITLKGNQLFTIWGLSEKATYTVTEKAIGDNLEYRGAATYSAGHSSMGDGLTKVLDSPTGKYVIESTIPASTTDPALIAMVNGIEISGAYADIVDTINRGQEITVSGTMVTDREITEGDTPTPAGTFEDSVIVFTNEKTLISPTGFVQTYWPYIVAVIVVLAAVGIFVGVRLKKKKSDTNTDSSDGL